MNRLNKNYDHYFFPVEKTAADTFVVLISSNRHDRPARYDELAGYIAEFYSRSIATVESSGRRFEAEVFLPNGGDDLIYVLANSEGIPDGCEVPRPQDISFLSNYLLSVAKVASQSEAILHEQRANVGLYFLTPNIRKTKAWGCKDGLNSIVGPKCSWLEPLENRRAVILGEPGAGKTTLLKRFAIELVDGFLIGDQFSHLVPVFVQLREFDKIDLHTWIFRQLKPSLKESESDESLLALSRSGQIVILLDGMDEILPEKKSDCLEQIERLDKHFPNARIIITCRKSAYEKPLFNFQHFFVDPLNLSQIREFSSMRLQERKSLDSFLGRLQAEPFLQSVLSSPLLLSLLLARYERNEVSPHHFAQLIDEFLVVLTDSWDSSRGIIRSRLNDQRPGFRKALLSSIALFLLDSHSVSFTAEQLNKDPGTNAKLLSENLLESLASATGIIERIDGHNWRFKHTLMMEFLAASYLIDDFSDIRPDLAKELESDEERSIWRFVCGQTSNLTELLASIIPSQILKEHRKLENCLTLSDALTETMSLSSDAIKLYSELLAQLASSVLNDMTTELVEPAVVNQVSGEAQLKIKFRSLADAEKNSESLKKLLFSFFRLRDSLVHGELTSSFAKSDNKLLSKLSELLECEGRIRFHFESSIAEIFVNARANEDRLN